MPIQTDPLTRNETSRVNVPAVLQRYQSAEDEYLGTFLDEGRRQAYRDLTKILFATERFVTALGYCDHDDTALEMIVCIRKILMEHREAASRFKYAKIKADEYLRAQSKILSLLQEFRTSGKQENPVDTDGTHWLDRQQSELKKTSAAAPIFPGDAQHSGNYIELLERAYLSCNEDFIYWTEQEETALEVGGNVSNVGASNRHHEGAILSAVCRAFDRVITPHFSRQMRVGRLELIADLASLIYPNHSLTGRDVEGYLSNRRRQTPR